MMTKLISVDTLRKSRLYDNKGNFGPNPNKRQYTYILTPTGIEEKTRITLAFLKRKEAELEAIKYEIEALKSDLETAQPSAKNQRAAIHMGQSPE